MDGIEDHPDLRDEGWARDALRRARREARWRRLRSWRPRRGHLAGVAAAVVAGLLVWAVFATRSGRSDAFDPDEPFAGTTATTWADGADGVVAPRAEPVGGFTAEQVADAYARVRQAVVTARLDRRVLVDHDPEPLVALFAPDLRDSLRTLFDGRNDGEAALLATRVDRGARLAEAEPKVLGEMAAEAGPAGELVVRTDYTFAYAFRPDRPEEVRGPLDAVAVARFQVRYSVRSGPPGVEGLWADDSLGTLRSISCSAAARGYLAPAFAQPDLPPGLEFDVGAPASPTDGCPG
ncbi:hypothetical protein [Saccharothrix syringae]|uniref:Uncharacterized protein n=1 Tax=Saccharothrix syringae TaxID=103733 RepID=A0A5Q0GT00_SACSY|nr:hypothetical protein [Saccharothrix syringae]QFZ17216.1 hypothetical protein EKG83_06820 [Saccharothrix syringae]